MLEQGVVQPSQSQWASPVVLVAKKDGSTCFCVDYHKLNAITKMDVYPSPRIDDSLDILARARYFSTLDLMTGYSVYTKVPGLDSFISLCSTHGRYFVNMLVMLYSPIIKYMQTGRLNTVIRQMSPA